MALDASTRAAIEATFSQSTPSFAGVEAALDALVDSRASSLSAIRYSGDASYVKASKASLLSMTLREDLGELSYYAAETKPAWVREVYVNFGRVLDTYEAHLFNLESEAELMRREYMEQHSLATSQILTIKADGQVIVAGSAEEPQMEEMPFSPHGPDVPSEPYSMITPWSPENPEPEGLPIPEIPTPIKSLMFWILIAAIILLAIIVAVMRMTR